MLCLAATIFFTLFPLTSSNINSEYNFFFHNLIADKSNNKNHYCFYNLSSFSDSKQYHIVNY
uniref:Uncharacterized protein n=1 Tax=Rhizophora mucronata TaxID=61149 RepID=A0A2P2MN09_RHIMU